MNTNAPEIVAAPKVAQAASTRVHIGRAIAAVSSGILLGCVLGTFGSGHKPAAPSSIPGIGTIQMLRLPISARKLNDVQEFMMSSPNFDDFGRVYVNNYLVVTSENDNADVAKGFGEVTLATRGEIRGFVETRSNFGLGPFDARPFLKPGPNFIVAELENALGPCSSRLDISVNGTRLEGFPAVLGINSTVEESAVSKALLSALRKIVFAPNHAVCARRIYQFDLE